MGYKINEEEKVIYADMIHATKKDIKKINEYVEKGYRLEQKKDSSDTTGPMPHNMGIHADSRLI